MSHTKPTGWSRKLKKARASPSHCWAVTKTMQTDARGAIKLTRKFGEALVCVRYRISQNGSERITTVELEVDRAATQKRANPRVAVKIYGSEKKLAEQAKQKGAWFNARTRLWQMRQNDALALGLTSRIARPEKQK